MTLGSFLHRYFILRRLSSSPIAVKNSSQVCGVTLDKISRTSLLQSHSFVLNARITTASSSSIQQRHGIFANYLLDSSSISHRITIPQHHHHCKCYHQQRLFSSSGGDDENDNKKENSSDEDTALGISKSDLNLAINAAKEEEGPPSTSFSDIPGAQKGGRKLAIIYTCTVCDTRSAKKFSEQAYNHGVVLVRCPKCENLHLIADHLGFFEDGGSWDIESFMKEKGESVRAVTNENVLELTMADIMGSSASNSGSNESK
mmetsp:Transcript_36496/g.53504  ORF Transcript_36496/g.53504 Transcript_36496/m.53504 type:complete len:259 (+) Transcript_36496:75-851(+)|eukprot:CAMPEP_0195511658 /NCGR_PEP_ID=MMETSP0794_2-20130614/3907_1 /TAXON_ID=515487 /ORGANISM="Stephanopyxis turris, Strain CCMP 815" /LENGTH=258 /DNA_ID=CAMNT_0040639309 /DNA_START=74 /DNA_END=850 /DNA_ORIENTATION=-